MIVESIDQVMSLPIEGEHWFNCRMDYTTLKDEFVQGTNEEL